MKPDNELILDIASNLLSGMPSEFSKNTTDEQAAQWAIARAKALVKAYSEAVRS